MLVELRPLGSIRPYPGNPRRNDHAVDAVAKSIQEFGFRQPIVVDADDVIVVGHTRLKAALKLGLAEVPVHVAVGLTATQAKAYRLADNQTATIAEWDDDAIVSELLGLREQGFDLDLTGFAGDDLTRLLGDNGEPVLGDPEDVPEPPAEAVTRPGDLWLLGPHRLVCGDAADPAAYARLLEGEPADLLLTDPPYNVAYEGKTAGGLTIANDDMADDAYQQFLADALKAAAGTVKPGGAFYLWHADLHGLTVRLACRDAALQVRQCLVWVKQAFTLGRQDYHWRHEPCLYGWRDGAAHAWLGGRALSTVLEFDRPARNGDHPTMKPVALFESIVRNSCPEGGVVLDPFAGSGTALAAAEVAGRRAALLELDPRYCDVIVKRYERLTGKAADRVAAERVAEPATA
jgi:DNA modification methylase